MSSRVYIAPFGEPVAATLDLGQPGLGGQVRYGAEAGDFYRGIALDGNAGGDECCLSIPEAGTASDRDRLVCDQAGGVAGAQAVVTTSQELPGPTDNRWLGIVRLMGEARTSSSLTPCDCGGRGGGGVGPQAVARMLGRPGRT